MDLYNNAGYTMDLSFSVMERAMFHVDNAYDLSHVTVRGHVCKTNLQSNTAFRGFGGPQGMMMTETFVDEVAAFLGKRPEAVRELNLYGGEAPRTHYGQLLENCTVRRCWSECVRKAGFEEQLAAAEEFNRRNRWRKRGVSVVPVKFGIAFTGTHLNQSGALVQVYKDGSVLVTHGGTEMGQGLHTKVIQVGR